MTKRSTPWRDACKRCVPKRGMGCLNTAGLKTWRRLTLLLSGVTIVSFFPRTRWSFISSETSMRSRRRRCPETLYFSRGPQRNNLPETAVYVEPAEARFIQEKMPVGQAKLVLGYRTNIAYDDPLYFPLVLYNGILGGFPHSKAFSQCSREGQPGLLRLLAAGEAKRDHAYRSRDRGK